MFVRVYTVSPRRQELFALRYKNFISFFFFVYICFFDTLQIYRCLLYHVKGPKNFDDLKKMSPDGEPCATFTQAAQKRGLLESDDIYYDAMDDACVEKSNFTQLQRYFAMLLFHSRPSNPRKFFEKYIDEMNPPISANNPNIVPKSKETRGAEILRNLEYFFRGLGTSCLYVVRFFLFQIMLHCILYVLSEMGLPAVPNDFDFQQQAERIESDEYLNDFYGAERNRTSPQQFVFNQVEKLNKDQRAAFDRISSAILEGNDHRLFFVEGAGGCGKFLF